MPKVLPLKPCDHNLQETLDLAEQMIALSLRGDDQREDTGCGILYGVMRDAGFQIRHLAQREMEHHRRRTRRTRG